MKPGRLRIAIATQGRFHVLDLARELFALGHDVRFYSLVPPWRTRRFGLDRRCDRWVLPHVTHALALMKLVKRNSWRDWVSEKWTEAVDRAIASRLEPCDLFIGMSGLANMSGRIAKQRFGAKVWIERGSRHILSQKAILETIPGSERVPEYAVRRELDDYQQADVISLLSRHCEESFLEYGVPAGRLFRTPLGVNLNSFSPTAAPPADPPTIIMTGTWSLRKGCDLLVEAWKQLPGVRFLHVGPVQDCPLPTDSGFEHVDPVEQARLLEYYSRAHVFALASREDGFGMVIPQALACGLRAVCSNRTGGPDLAEMISDPTAVRIVPVGDVSALARALRASLDEARSDQGSRDRLGPVRNELSWAAYARRYEAGIFEKFSSTPRVKLMLQP